MAATKPRSKRKSASSYETDIAAQREKRAAAKIRLQKAKEKEVKRFIRIANGTGVFDFKITDEEIREVFDELVEKKSFQKETP